MIRDKLEGLEHIEKNIDELTKIQSANVDNLVKAKVNEVMKV